MDRPLSVPLLTLFVDQSLFRVRFKPPDINGKFHFQLVYWCTSSLFTTEEGHQIVSPVFWIHAIDTLNPHCPSAFEV